MGWLRRLRGTLGRSTVDDTLEEEMRFHLDERTDEYIRQGLTPDEARRETLRRFGNVSLARARAREVDTLGWLDDLRQDVRYALRTLRRNPGFTATAIAALALGIGANTAIFSVVNAVLLRPLGAPDADRLVRVTETYQGTPSWVAGLRTFNIWRQQTSTLEDISAHWLEFANLTNSSYPEQVPVARVTATFFHLFAAPIIRGRVHGRRGSTRCAGRCRLEWRAVGETVRRRS